MPTTQVATVAARAGAAASCEGFNQPGRQRRADCIRTASTGQPADYQTTASDKRRTCRMLMTPRTPCRTPFELNSLKLYLIIETLSEDSRL